MSVTLRCSCAICRVHNAGCKVRSEAQGMCLLCWCHVPGTGAVPCPVCAVVLSDGAAPFPCVVQTRTVAGAPVSAETCAAGLQALAPPSAARSSRRLRTSTLRVQATRPRTDRDTGGTGRETTATPKQRHARRPSYILVLHHARGCHAHPSCPTATVREHQAKPSRPYQWARPRGFSALNTTNSRSCGNWSEGVTQAMVMWWQRGPRLSAAPTNPSVACTQSRLHCVLATEAARQSWTAARSGIC